MEKESKKERRWERKKKDRKKETEERKKDEDKERKKERDRKKEGKLRGSNYKQGRFSFQDMMKEGERNKDHGFLSTWLYSRLILYMKYYWKKSSIKVTKFHKYFFLQITNN